MFIDSVFLGALLSLPVVPSQDAEALFFGDGEDRFGFQIASGDLDANGERDLVIAAPHPSFGNAVYVFFGPIDLASMPNLGPGDADVILQGPQGSEAGWSVGVGDVSGSGDDDLLVGAPSLSGGRGIVFAFEGPLASSSLDLGAADRSIEGLEAGDFLGWSLTAGDFDADGRDELVAGACFVGSGALEGMGAAYLFDLDIAAPPERASDATATFSGVGQTGCSVSSGGDFNGDGLEDLLIGSHGAAATTGFDYGGAVAIVYGRQTFAPSYDLLMGDPVAQDIADLTGEFDGSNLGYDLAPAGDVNGDGYDDLLIGAPASECNSPPCPPGWDDIGRVYVVLGTRDDGPGGGTNRPLSGRSVVSDVAHVIYENPGHDDGTGLSVAGAGYAGLTWSSTRSVPGGPILTGLVTLIGSRDNRAWAIPYEIPPWQPGIVYYYCEEDEDEIRCFLDFPAALTQRRIDISKMYYGGHEFQGAPAEVFGFEVHGGDFDGDGLGDLLFGATGQLEFEDPAGEGVVYGFQAR